MTNKSDKISPKESMEAWENYIGSAYAQRQDLEYKAKNLKHTLKGSFPKYLNDVEKDVLEQDDKFELKQAILHNVGWAKDLLASDDIDEAGVRIVKIQMMVEDFREVIRNDEIAQKKERDREARSKGGREAKQASEIRNEDRRSKVLEFFQKAPSHMMDRDKASYVHTKYNRYVDDKNNENRSEYDRKGCEDLKKVSSSTIRRDIKFLKGMGSI